MIRIVKSEAESTICNLELENTVLDTWYSASCSNETYVARLNAIIPGQALVVKQCNSCETRIKVKACKVYHKIRGLSRRKRQNIKAKKSMLTIFEGEVETVHDLRDKHRSEK